jgi:hypothetical protein
MKELNEKEQNLKENLSEKGKNPSSDAGATAQTRTQSRFPAGRPRQKAWIGKNEPGAQGRRDRGERAGQANPAKTPQLGGVSIRVTQLQSERSLRVKRSDP